MMSEIDKRTDFPRNRSAHLNTKIRYDQHRLSGRINKNTQIQEINIILVEPYRRRCEALLSMLSTDDNLKVIGAGEDLVVACEENVPTAPVDVLVIGLHEIGMVSREMWAQIHLLLPEVSVVVLTSSDDDEILLSILGARPIAIHRTNIGRRQLHRAIYRAACGKVDMDMILFHKAKTILTLHASNDIAAS